MKCAVLAGGKGTRMGGETEAIPKPMLEIGGRPILWHLLMHYATFGVSEFVLALGYRNEVIREYFRKDSGHSELSELEKLAPGLQVDLVETGRETATGGRIRRLRPMLGEDPFFLTWGDGLSDVNLDDLLKFHRSHGKLATVTAVHPPRESGFGRLDLDGDRVTCFTEKARSPGEWVNGAFFVLEPGVFETIESDGITWEREPLEKLAKDGELMAYRHEGFWQCMDTPDERDQLERLWKDGSAPWRTWTEPVVAP